MSAHLYSSEDFQSRLALTVFAYQFTISYNKQKSALLIVGWNI